MKESNMTMITTYFSNVKEEHLWILFVSSKETVSSIYIYIFLQVLLNQIDNMNLKICIKITSKQIQYVLNHQSLHGI